MKEKILKITEGFSKAMVQPLMYLAIVGLITTFGVLIVNPTISNFIPFLKAAPFQMLGNILYSSMMFIIENLGIIFAIGIASAYAKKDKHRAALISLMIYFTYLKSMNTMLSMMGKLVDPQNLMGSGQSLVLGVQVLDTGVFIGILIGCLVGFVYNRTCDKEFKGAMQMYSGTKFTLVTLIPIAIFLGVGLTFVWPAIQGVISKTTGFISDSGALGMFTYGFLDRILVPTGLHHLVYTPLLFSDLGGVVEVGGKIYAGAMPIAMMEMNNPEITKFSTSIIYQATSISKMFGLVGASLAMYHCAKPENKQKVKSILLPATITSVLVGITEPLEFAFLFAAPILLVVHALLTGLALAVLYILDVTSIAGGGIINVIIMNLAAGVDKSNWPMFFAVGIAQLGLYYALFRVLINKLNLKTPGREDKKESKEEKLNQVNNDIDVSYIVDGLGGIDNIVNVDNCFTRLRVEINDESLIKDDLINKVENSGIVKKGKNIQIIFGLQVSSVRQLVDKYLQTIKAS